MGYSIIQEHIKKRDFSRVYYFCGEESYLLDEYFTRLIDALIDEKFRDFDLVILDGEKATARKAIGAAMSLPLMNERKVVVIKDFDSMATEEKEGVVSFLEDVPISTCLILVGKKKPDGRTKLVSILKKAGALVEFNSPSKREIETWIYKKFRQAKKEISKEGVSLLMETVENDLTRLDNEIEKFLLYLGEDGREITPEDIRVLSPRTLERTIFEFIDAVARRDKSLALRNLSELFREGQPYTMLLFMLVRQIRMLLRTKLLIERGITRSSDILKSLPIRSPYEAEKFTQQSRNFSLDELTLALERLQEADVNIKTGKRDPRLELEMTIIDICK